MECDLCGEGATIKCPTCEITKYCSVNCANADAEYHENICFNRDSPERHKLVAACIAMDIECAYHRNLERARKRENGDSDVSTDEDTATEEGESFENAEIGDMIDFVAANPFKTKGQKKRSKRKRKLSGKGKKRTESLHTKKTKRQARKARRRTKWYKPGGLKKRYQLGKIKNIKD